MDVHRRGVPPRDPALKSPDLPIKIATITGSIFPPPRTGPGIICAVHPTPLSLFPAPKRLGMGIKRRAAFEKTSLMSDKSSVGVHNMDPLR
jgi:hypothetical protein